MDIADASAVSVYGDQLRMAAVNKLANFFINAVGIENQNISVIITGFLYFIVGLSK